ncbi:MAG: hypothetical protein JWQ11_3813 [Rhizobacter sp.]|nr:hypothetical protein [Rhizobacter sp.]
MNATQAPAGDVVPFDAANAMNALDEAIDALAFLMPDHRVEFHGPHTAELEPVRRFLHLHQRMAGLHHLQEASQLLIERRLRIDDRSTHCCLYRRDVLVAVVRLMPAPFEAGELHPGLGRLAADFDGHLDFGRLVASPDAHDSRRVPLLLAQASRWACLAGYDGTTALARAPQRRLYQRFGLRAVSELPSRLATRGDAAYWLLQGEWSAIAAAADAVVRSLAHPTFERRPPTARIQPPPEIHHA